VYIVIFGHGLNDGHDGGVPNPQTMQKNQDEMEKLRLSMYDYPIYQNLKQFSNMVDSNGMLMKQPNGMSM
jgi:hypothetical protein